MSAAILRFRGEVLARADIEHRIEAMIALLDGLDGDPDLEEDDPSGDVLDRGEGDDSRPQGVVLPFPRYGTDQSAGPINLAEIGEALDAARVRSAFV